MALRMKKEEALVEVTRTLHDKEAENEETRVKIRPFITDTARVSVKYGLTISTAQFEFARVDILVEVPCYVEEISDVYEKVAKIVEARILKEHNDIKANTGDE